MARFLLFVLLIVGSSISFSLDVFSLSLNTNRCEFYFPGSSSVDSDVTDLLKIVKSGSAVKLCADIYGNKSYYIATRISKKNEIHYFYLRRVFKIPVSNSYRWEYSPPKDSLQFAARKVYMQRAVDGGVRQDDSGFVQVQEMSIALFDVLDKSWKGILSSEKNFNEACGGFLSILSISSIISSDIKSLKRALYIDDHQDVPKLLSVEFVEGDVSSSPHYTLSLANKLHEWHVEFDFNGDSIRIESIDGIVLRSE